MRERTILILGTYLLSLGSVSASEEFIVLGEGYRKNLESFPTFTCKFTVGGGQAPSVKEVFDDRNVTHTGGRVLYGTWIVKGAYERIYITSDNKLPIGKAFNFKDSAISYNFTSDGKNILDVGLSFPVARLKSVRGNEGINDLGTPVNCGIMMDGDDLGSLAERHARKGGYVEFIGKQDIFGRETLAFKTGENKHRLGLVLFIDPQRGFFPVKADRFDPETGMPMGVALITSVKEYSKGRWFPNRSVLVYDARNSPCGFREFKVTHFDPDSFIGDEHFAITFPKDYQMQLEKDKFALLTTSEEKVYQVSDLPTLLNELKKSGQVWKSQAEKGASPKITQERSGFSTRTILAVIFLLAILIGSYLWLRRGKKKSALEVESGDAGDPLK